MSNEKSHDTTSHASDNGHGDSVTWADIERESANCPVLYRMIQEMTPRYRTALQAHGEPNIILKYLLYLSRVRRNWIDAEVERKHGDPPRQVLGETYERRHDNKDLPKARMQ